MKKLRCEDVQEALAGDDFDGPLVAALDHHLSGCAECMQVATLLRGAVDAMRDLALPPPPLTLVTRALATAAPELAARRAAPSRKLAYAAAVTASVLLALLAFVRQPAPVAVPDPVASVRASVPAPTLAPKPAPSARAVAPSPRAAPLVRTAPRMVVRPSWPPVDAVPSFAALTLTRHLVRPVFNTGNAQFAFMGQSLRTATLGQGLLRITDVRSLAPLHVVTAPIDGALSVLPGDAGLLIAGASGVVRADVTTASVTFTRLSTEPVDELSAPRKPGAPALVVHGGAAYRLDLATGRRTELKALGEPGEQLTCSVSPDGRRAWIASRTPARARVWDLDAGRELWTRTDPHEMKPVWSPDGESILVFTFDGRAALHEASTGRVRWDVQPDRDIRAVAISEDGQVCAIRTDEKLALHDSRTGAERVHLDLRDRDATHRVWSAAPAVGFDARGERVYTVDPCGRVRFFDATALTERFAAGRQPAGFAQLALAPDGRRAAVRGRATAIQLVNLETGALGEGFGATDGLLLHFDARGALVDVGPREVRIHARGAPVRTISLAPATARENEAVDQAACDANGDRLYVTTSHGRLAAFDLGSAALLDQVDVGAYNGMAIDGSGARVVVDTMNDLKTFDGRHAFAPVAKGFVQQLQRPRKLAMSRGGTRFALGLLSHLGSATSDVPVSVYSAGDGRLEFGLPGGQSQVTALAFAPDGRALVSGALDGRLRVYDLERRALVQELELPDRPDHVEGITIDPAGRTVLVGTARGALLRYRLDDLPPRQVEPIAGAPGALRTLVPAGSGEPGDLGGAQLLAGERLATIGSDGGLRVRDLSSGQVVAEVRNACAPGHSPLLLGFSPPTDSVLLEVPLATRYDFKGGSVTATPTADIEAWNAMLAEWRRNDSGYYVGWNPSNRVQVTDLATGATRDLAPGTSGTHDWARHGTQVALVADGELQAFDARTGGRRWMRRVTAPDMRIALAYSADGLTLAVRTETPPAVELVDAATGAARASFPCRPGTFRRFGLFCTAGGRLVTAFKDGGIECRDLATGEELRWSRESPGRLYRAALSGDGKRAAWRSQRGSLTVADVATGRLSVLASSGESRALALSGDGARLVDVGGSEVRHWDLTSTPHSVESTLSQSATGGAAITPDLAWLARGIGQGSSAQVELVDLATHAVRGSWSVNALNVPHAIATSADARVVAAASDTRVVVAARRPLGDDHVGFAPMRAPFEPGPLAISADGAWGAAGNDPTAVWFTSDPTVHLYDMQRGETAVGLGDHLAGTMCLRFLDGARYLLTGSADGRVRLFDVQRRTLVAELALPSLPDQPLAFAASADDRRVLITTARGAVYVLER